MSMRNAVVTTLAALVVLASAPVYADGRTTAGEVTDRPTLKAFVEAAKEYLEGLTTVAEIAQMAHFFRVDGPWNAGDMYLMTMTTDGSVLTHGEDPTADAKDLIAVRDESGRQVVQEMLAAAERGGDFVDYRWEGTDRTAYAAPYTSGLSGWPLLVVGGFAQDLSSVPVEITPLPRPEVTAAQVRDRETLRTFVEAAAKVYEAAGWSGIANVQNAFRQEDGDWKSGDVYVFVVSTDGYTLFHGGFPLRFEGRQFEDIDRQDANGVRYLRELLAAGEAGGGFVEYLFDNPAVEGDEELGSPKIAYATGYRRPGSETVFVVASGFYPEEAAAARR